MLKRFSVRFLLILSSCVVMTTAQAQPQHPLKMAIGEPGSKSFVFGTELWAMGQIALKHKHGIDLAAVEVVDDWERVALLHSAAIEVALVDGDVLGESVDQARTVLALWPDSGPDVATKPAQIIAHENVSEEVIYQLTKAIFENGNFFKASQEQLGTVSIDSAIVGVDLPIHAGALRYYEEKGVDLDLLQASSSSESPALVPVEPRAAEVTSAPAATFLDFDDKGLSNEERAQVAAACRQALEEGALSLVLGDLSSTGCEVYQSQLEEQAINRHEEASVDVDPFAAHGGGQGGPAIALDSVQGQKDRSLRETTTRSPRTPTM